MMLHTVITVSHFPQINSISDHSYLKLASITPKHSLISFIQYHPFCISRICWNKLLFNTLSVPPCDCSICISSSTSYASRYLSCSIVSIHYSHPYVIKQLQWFVFFRTHTRIQLKNDKGIPRGGNTE